MCKQISEKVTAFFAKEVKWTRILWEAWLLNIIVCAAAFALVPRLYYIVSEEGEVGVAVDSALYNSLQGNLPAGLQLRNDTLFTRKCISAEEQIVLSTLVEKDNAVYPDYVRSIDQLAYASNNGSMESWRHLIWLTLCFVLMGCVARTISNYIGLVCYGNKKQDMERWWAWYVLRIVLCAPIAAFIIVASRSAMFSTLFTSRDLNTYLVISFLAGFAIIEFLDMLRNISKGIFSRHESSKSDN